MNLIKNELAKVSQSKVNTNKFNYNCVSIYSYSNNLEKLFPQYGSGRKHKRKIALQSWQQEILNEFPYEFLKGMIYSDGCIFWNKQSKSYCIQFSNKSEDLKQIFENILDNLKIPHSRAKWGEICQITNKESVQKIMEHIPLKS